MEKPRFMIDSLGIYAINLFLRRQKLQITMNMATVALNKESGLSLGNVDMKTIVWRTTQKDSFTIQKTNESTIQKNEFTIQKNEFTIQKNEFTIQKNEFTIQKNESTTQKNDFTTQKELTTTQKAVLDYFKHHPNANREEAIHDIEGMTEGGIKFIIGKLQQLGLLKREGGRKNGTWVVIEKNDRLYTSDN